MSLNLQPQTFKTTKKGAVILTRSQPYIRLRSGEEAPIFIQSGKFWYEGQGDPIPEKEMPKWVAIELKKVSEEAKREVGLGSVSED